MTPDPVLDKLARFTPDGSQIDPAELLFRAGRASARTHWGWKAVVAGLLLANLGTAGFLVLRSEKSPLPPEPAPVQLVVPAAVPSPEPPPPEAPASPDPDSLGSLARVFDPDSPPPPAGFVPPDHPAEVLTVGSRDQFN